jgi:hypothetical protein
MIGSLEDYTEYRYTSKGGRIGAASMKAQPYNFSTWQTMQSSVYGTCMVEHGQTP